MKTPVLILALAAVALAGGVCRADVTDEQVQAAIDRGIRYLLDTQTPKGWWSDDGSLMGWNYPYNGGAEACAMLPLAYAGVGMDEPKMKKGFDALLGFKMSRTYNCALRIMVLSKMLKTLDRERRERAMAVIKADATVLVKIQHVEGGWAYPPQDTEPELPPLPVNTQWWDFSNTQMAVLGLSEAIHAGLEIPVDVMKKAQKAYLDKQRPDGGWSYGAEVQAYRNHSYGSMTAAGVASLFITRDYIYRGVGCPCRGNRSSARPVQVDKAIDGGLDWLGKHFIAKSVPSVVPANGQLDSLTIYWLYACERVGLASGMKYFGGHDWYDEGAEFLIRRQQPPGQWGRIHNTAFALCFLIKGKAPLLLNKLRFNGKWDMHPRDAANLAAYVGQLKEQPIRWQIINLEAPVDEWHDAPILYISAESPLALGDADKKKLREFTDSGGTILFEASCGNQAAATAWKTLAREIWPQWEMTRLDKDHPLFTADQDMSRGRLPVLYGMSDGVRTFAFVSLVDISCAWSTFALSRRGPLFTLGANLHAYATDRRPLRAGLADKKTPAPAKYRGAQLQPGRRTEIKVARVKHGGDWYVGENYAALQRMAARETPRCPVRLNIADALSPSALPGAGVALAHLGGRQGATLSDAEAGALKAFLEGGGFLLAEAVMGDPRFDAAFRTVAGQVGLALKPLGAEDPLIRGNLNGASGYDVSSVRVKHALRVERMGKPLPVLFGIHLNDKLVGVYSPYDLSYSQAGFDAWDCRGYEPADATAVLTNILLLVSTR